MKSEGGSTVTTRLFEAGRSLCGLEVTTEQSADEVVGFAVTELCGYLSLITGGAVCVDGDAPVRVHVGTRASLGLDDLPAPADGYDGYVLQVRPDRIVVAGDGPRGTLYGVYDLLERLGCRWYYPAIDPQDPEIVPSSPTIDVEPFTAVHASPFEYRVCHPSSMIYALHVDDAMAQVDWAAKARYNVMLFLLTARAVVGEDDAIVDQLPAQALEGEAAPATAHLMSAQDFWEGTREYETTGVAPAMRRRGMRLEGPNHCMAFLLPNDLFDSHPDWFGMLEGERRPQGGLGPEFCWGNPEAVAYFTDSSVAWLRANPHLDVFSCAPNDGGKACECERCAGSTPSDLYAALCNELQRKIDAAGLAVEIEILGGYNPVTDPPLNVSLDPRIRVHWAHWGRGHDDWYGKPDYLLRDNIDRWVASGTPVTMVEYYTDAFATPAIFPPVAAVIDRDNAWLVEQGFAGNCSLMFPHGSWWAYSLNGWLAITWYYADRSGLDFLDDYCTHYFGAAAEPMRAYHRLLATEMWLGYFCQGARWEAPVWCPVPDAERAGPYLDEMERLLDEAERLAVTPIDRYRLSRLLAQGRVLVLVGRARVESTPVVHAHALAVAEGRDLTEIEQRMTELLEHEEKVIEPAVRALSDLVGVVPPGDSFERDKLIRSSASLRAALGEPCG